jgi:hypothetical protein
MKRECRSGGAEREELLRACIYPVYGQTLFEIDERLPEYEMRSDQEHQEARIEGYRGVKSRVEAAMWAY